MCLHSFIFALRLQMFHDCHNRIVFARLPSLLFAENLRNIANLHTPSISCTGICKQSPDNWDSHAPSQAGFGNFCIASLRAAQDWEIDGWVSDKCAVLQLQLAMIARIRPSVFHNQNTNSDNWNCPVTNDEYWQEALGSSSCKLRLVRGWWGAARWGEWICSARPSWSIFPGWHWDYMILKSIINYMEFSD